MHQRTLVRGLAQRKFEQKGTLPFNQLP